jgi:hypothetical protein
LSDECSNFLKRLDSHVRENDKGASEFKNIKLYKTIINGEIFCDREENKSYKHRGQPFTSEELIEAGPFIAFLEN